MNKKALSLVTVSTVAILGLIMAFTTVEQSTTFKVNENFDSTLNKYSEMLSKHRSPPPTALSVTYANQVEDVMTSRQLTNVDAKTPTILPEGFELKGVFYESRQSEYNHVVSQFYLPVNDNITSETTFRDVMDKGGFVIIQVNEDPEKITNEWPSKVGEYTPTFSKIGDSTVMVISGVGTKGHDSQIFFYRGNTFVNLVSVSLNADELLKIANSMY